MNIKAYTQDFKESVARPLIVLMWKHMKARKNCYYYTLWEIFGGLLVFLVLFLVNQTIRPIQEKQAHITNDTDSDSESDADDDGVKNRVFFTPHNNFTRHLMRKVGYSLNNNPEPDFMPKLEWDFVEEDDKIPNEFNSSDSVAVVKFKSSGSYDNDFIYSINVIPKEKKNDMYHLFHGLFTDIDEIEEETPPFLASLQWAIDKSYMEQLSDQEIGQSVQMRAKSKYITRELRGLQKFMIICTIIAPLPFFLINSSRLSDERSTGLKELMKLAGVSRNVLRLSRFLDMALVGVIYATLASLLLKGTSTPILPYSDGVVVGVTLMLHYLSSTSLAFVTTTLSQDYNYAASLGLFIYISTFFFDFIWYSHDTAGELAIYFICSILPHAPVYMFWDEVLYLEKIGVGIQSWNMGRQHSDTILTVWKVWIFSITQIILIMTLSWYLDLVRPGRYGVSKKWNFLFKRFYWKRTKNVNSKIPLPPAPPEQAVWDQRDEKYFERGPRKAEIALKIVNVTKIFKAFRGSKLTALDRVKFDCYKGEVTVVLGVNGAGKSTLLSIVTGMYSPTKGAVFINGKNVAHRLKGLGEVIGFCSQKNLTFHYLTVKENIMFFQMLKLTTSESDLTVEQLMKKLKLKHKANYFTSSLSNGMLRCLQVACALASGAEVLVLDEPTSGMDVEVRHRLWDLIMVLRGEKTILMTTTCLEEATALGDRIVILNNGKLRCHGTPMFLKQALGVSCNLSVTIKDSTHMMYLKEIVEDIVPHAQHRIEDIKRITFSLPSKEQDKFPELFKALEKNRDELGIILIDVGMFMEEVFLEFVEEDDDEPYDMYMSLSCRHIKMDKISGWKLLKRQIRMLIARVIEYSWLNKYQFIIWQIIIPIVGFIIITLTTNRCLGYGKMFSHHEYHSHDVTSLVYNTGPFRRRGVTEVVLRYPKLTTVHSHNVDKEFSDPIYGYMSESIIGLKMMEHYTRIFHPQEPHAISKSINMYSNIYMSVHMPYHNRSIITTYEPLLGTAKRPKETKSVFLCLKWSIWVVFLSIIPLAPLILLSIKEYRNGTRDNHLMAGCSAIVHWGSKFLAHMAGYLAIIPVPLIIITVFLDLDKTFNQLRFIGAFVMILLAFGPAFLTHMYFLSFLFQAKFAVCQVYIMSLCLGTILPIAMEVLEPVWEAHIALTLTYVFFTAVGRISPLFAYTVGLARVALQARSNAYCRLNKPLCPDLHSRVMFDAKLCCQSKSPMPFRYMEDYFTGLYDFLTLIFQFIVYSLLVILLEKRVPQYVVERILKCKYRVTRSKFFDPKVSKEADYVRSKLRVGDVKNDVLLAHNIHKTYKTCFNKTQKSEPVKGISISAKLGECMCIIGPQDCGKTSLLRMLSGDLVMTRGDCVVNGHHIRKNRSKYIHSVCLTTSPFGMDPFRTGVQNLSFLAMLQGYSQEMAFKISLLALHFMGLQANASAVRQYSAGCIRRLGLCGALVTVPSLALLDEPMQDVDATSRPRVARALKRLVLEPGVVIVAESTVDWGLMESVYSRIAVLSEGELAALGPAHEIHNKVANGYTARIKLKVCTAYREDRNRVYDEDEESSSSSSEEEDAGMHSAKSVMYARDIVAFKKEFKKKFKDSTILGEHLCMIYFHIQDPDKNLQYSEMFQVLEEFKAKYPDVVEDYVLSSTTVEDVFWRLKHSEPQNTEADQPVN